MSALTLKPSVLKGILPVPPSKSITHRALISAYLSGGGSIDNICLCEDTRATQVGLKTIDGTLKGPVDCLDSATTLRFLLPISLTGFGGAVFTGSQALFGRPNQAYLDLLSRHGATIETDDCLIKTRGLLIPGEYIIDGNISSQFISGLLLALPLLDEPSKIIINGELQSRCYVEITRMVQKAFGVESKWLNKNTLYIKPQEYFPVSFTVEADWSYAAFFIAANRLGNKVVCERLNPDSLQDDKLITKICNRLRYKHKLLDIDVSQTPDLTPAVAVAAALREGDTHISNAGRLRYKESDRLHALATQLSILGANITEEDEGLYIKGKPFLNGGKVDSCGDHRIAMALAVAATRCQGEVQLTGWEDVKKSAPYFWSDYKKLGGYAYEQQLR